MRVYCRRFGRGNRFAFYLDLQDYLKEFMVIFPEGIRFGNKRPDFRKALEYYMNNSVKRSEWCLVREPEEIELVQSRFKWFENIDYKDLL